MLNVILFCIVIFLSNIIQGITGFAGTILAMPFSIMLVGYATAQPILNFLGLLSGIIFMIGGRHEIRWQEMGRVLLFMAAGIVFGFFLRDGIAGSKHVLMLALSCAVILIGAAGLIKELPAEDTELLRALEADLTEPGKKHPRAGRIVHRLLSDLLLFAAGIIHGVFISGGPLLISYLSKRIRDKAAFRATISTVWVFLNGMIFATDAAEGYYSSHVITLQIITVLFCMAGLNFGSFLYRRMSQKVFFLITDGLLIAAGVSLLV